MPRSASDKVRTGFFLAAMIPLNEGYRGSLMVSQVETIAGSGASTAQYPPSVCRSIFATPPSTVSLRAPDSCAMPSRSLSSAGITLICASVASAPHRIRSYSS
jgi:hypothetical protein